MKRKMKHNKKRQTPTQSKRPRCKICLPEDVADISRRDLLKYGSSFAAALTAHKLLLPQTLQAQTETFLPAKNLVWINMGGGWDILEATDPKTSSTSGIDMIYDYGLSNTVSGSDVRIGRWLPNLAALGDDLLVIRGISMGTTSHAAGSMYMNTGILSNTGEVNRASIPGIVASNSEATIPVIQLNGGSEVLTDRFLENEVAVMRAGNIRLYQSMYPTEQDYIDRKIRMLDYLKGSIQRLQNQVGTNDRLSALGASEDKVRAQLENNLGANLQVEEQDLAPFADPPANARTGNLVNNFALALKLLKSDLVTSVNLGIGGFDTHSNQTARLQPILEGADFIIAKFVQELKAAGKLDSTLIVIYSDFGRTPKVNGGNGRDHWPFGGAMFIGGGIQGGRVVGATDDNLRGVPINLSTGLPDENGTMLAPEAVVGSALSLCMGSTYFSKRESYLQAIEALTRLKT